MRAAVRFAWRGAFVIAFGATAALAVTLNRPAPAPAAMTTATRQQPQPPGCAAAALAVSLASGTGGLTGYPVDFTNTSGRACTLSGYPSVAAYDARADGYLQIGNAADADPSVAAHRVLLRPGAIAHSDVDVSSIAPGAACRPVTVTGLRVVAPGASRPQYLRVKLTACSADGPRARVCLHVRAVQPGPGRVATSARQRHAQGAHTGRARAEAAPI